ncbi:MAG: hypothetical protein KMY53_16000 [Desulfarculus sp.]|nr:hypothetical protein [Desulfarculus sp.]
MTVWLGDQEVVVIGPGNTGVGRGPNANEAIAQYALAKGLPINAVTPAPVPVLVPKPKPEPKPEPKPDAPIAHGTDPVEAKAVSGASPWQKRLAATGNPYDDTQPGHKRFWGTCLGTVGAECSVAMAKAFGGADADLTGEQAANIITAWYRTGDLERIGRGTYRRV